MAKILVAGSDSTEREGRALLLEFAGHKCATAGSLEEAVELLKEGYFDLAITDLELDGSMPEEIASSIKRASPDVAVIVITESNAIAIEADAVLAVPCSPEELFQSIQYLLGKSHSPAGPIAGNSLDIPEISNNRKPTKSEGIQLKPNLSRVV